MSAVFRATDAPAASRTEYWRHVLDDGLVPMDVRFDDGPDDRDQLRTSTLGAVRVTEVATGPGEERRTPRLIRRSDLDIYQLLVQLDGTVTGEQNGHRVDLAPGDLSLTHLSRPFRCTHGARRSVTMTFPPDLLPLRRADVAGLLGDRLDGDTATGSLVSAVAGRAAYVDEDPGHARVGTAMLDLLTVVLSDRLDRTTDGSEDARRRVLLARIDDFIETRLDDPGFSPAMVAAAHHISLRYLYKLFESRERSVAAEIRSRRLERCRRDLLDPALAGRTVSAIAARWGYPNAAHFNRQFRAVYGDPPGEYRLRYLGVSRVDRG